MSTGGAAYDGRKVAEARKLVDAAWRTYPELASHESEFLNRQLYSITMQQAAKDYEIAEFYRRTGKPCSAYFCYEVVRLRYPGTQYFDLATERMHELRAKVEKLQGKEAVAPGQPGLQPGQPETAPRQMPPELMNSQRAGAVQ
jgi:hypothetical protein